MNSKLNQDLKRLNEEGILRFENILVSIASIKPERKNYLVKDNCIVIAEPKKPFSIGFYSFGEEAIVYMCMANVDGESVPIAGWLIRKVF